MDKYLGFLAGCGMLLLIGGLIAAFLRQMGVMTQAGTRRVIRCAMMTFFAGLAYFFIGALIYQVFYGKLESAARVDVFFQGPYLQRMFSALNSPSWFAPVSGAFAWMGHLLGRLFFGQFLFGGIVLAWGAVFFSLFLLQTTLERLFGLSAAKDLSLLLLCCPGSVFLFLPGWPCFALFIVSCAVCICLRRFRQRTFLVPSVPFSWALACCVCLNAAVLTCMVFGKLG